MNRLSVLGATLFFAIQAVTASAAIPQPLFPSGIVNDRTPTFRWTSTGASQYTVELTVDDSAQQKITVAQPRMKRPAPLNAGVYRWRVKEGNVVSASPWSAEQAFTILPYSPDPLTPDYWLNPAPATPVFEWDNEDPLANLFAIQLYRNNDLIDSVTTAGSLVGPSSFELVWSESLPAGTYKWRMRGIRKHAQDALTLKSGWTGFLDFSVGVPHQPRITKPAAGASFAAGDFSLATAWTAPAGSTAFSAKILCNGADFLDFPGLTVNSNTTFRYWGPGHYVLLARAHNGYGNSVWSEPCPFLITRNMTPGDDHMYLGSTNRLSWARSWKATRYRVRLSRVNPATGAYEKLQEGSVVQSAGQPFYNPGTLSTGAYRWQVTDFDGNKALYTSTAFFSIDVPSRPGAREPLKDISGMAGVEFIWEALSFATHYQMQILKDGSPVKDTGWKTKAELTKGPTLLFQTCNLGSASGVYHWRVRAKNDAGVGGWRDTRVTFNALPALVIKQPADNSSYPVNTSISIVWKSVPGNVRYQIQFWNQGDLKKEAWVSRTTAATASYTWLVGAGPWSYRVRAAEDAFGPWTTRTITGL